MSSSLIVEVCEIKEIKEHKNADALEILVIKGWESISKKDQYKVGDTIIYIPPDVLVSEDIIEKYSLKNYLAGKKQNRVKCIKLRGEMSFGLVLPNEENLPVGTEVSERYNFQKYIPPIRITAGDAAPEDPFFDRYTDIENIRNFPDVFEEGEMVVVTEKIDGCFRFDQKISLVNGEQISISDINIGDMVLSYDEKEDDLVESKVENVISKNISKEWVELSFDNGKDIVCTADHLFLTRNRGWVEATELEEEDELVELEIK